MAPKPSCESPRLEALYRYDILDTASDSSFDDLARLASYICCTPIAAISFVDAERQWFKSAVGLDHKETPRDIAFCAHTILGSDLLTVGKADEDERFRNHPWVIEPPALRFYAGVPLISPDGYAIGSLAVMDAAPRILSPEQLACLRTIANQVMAQLELRRAARLDNRRKPDRRKEIVTEQKKAEEIFREIEHKFRSIFEQAPVGIATIDSITGRFKSVNASYCAIVGYASEEMLSRTFLDITHPDDLQADLDQMKRILDGEIATFEMDKRYFRKNGDTIWVHLTCVPLWQRPSDPRVHLAIVQDISERKLAEERTRHFQDELEQLVESRTTDLQRTHRLLQSVIDSSPDWIFVKDREHRFVLVNKAFAASQQLTPADMAGRLDSDFWSTELCEGNAAKGIRGFHTDDRRAFAGELIHNPYDPASLHDGTLRIFDTYKGPWHDPNGQIGGVLCYARDVTEQRRAEEIVRQLNSDLAIRVDERTVELAQVNRMLEADIAERKQAEEERSKQELLISLMLSTGPGCIKRVAADGTLLHMNPAGLAMAEACREKEVIGLSVFDLVLPEHRTAFINMHQDVISGNARTLQFEIQGLRGGRKWMETHAVPFRNPGTGSMEHLAVTHDITERKQAEQELTFFRTLLDYVDDSIEIINPQTGQFLDGNKGAATNIGYTRDEFLTLTVPDIDPLVTLPVFAGLMKRLREAPGPIILDSLHRRKDGTTFPVEVSAQLIRLNKDYLVTIVRDSTERKRIEEALQSSEERFRLVAEATQDILWDWDLTAGTRWWSQNGREKFGCDLNDMPGDQAWVSRLHPDDRGQIRSLLQDVLASSLHMFSGEYRFRLKDGTYGYFIDRAYILRDGLGKPTRMIGAMIDVTAAKQAYASLQEAYHRLQTMANELQTVESNERRRLSRELHDEVGQLLTALKFDLESVKRAGVGMKQLPTTQVTERLTRALDTTDLLFSRLRQIVRALRPPVLEELGLKAALGSLATDAQARTGIACSVVIEGDDHQPGISPTRETAIYRIAQELLTNVIRHAQAKSVSISLALAPDHWILAVEDDGIGFDPTALQETDGVGLRGIRERVEILGGRVDVTSQHGQGTLAVVWTPVVADQTPRTARKRGGRTPSVRRRGRKRAHD